MCMAVKRNANVMNICIKLNVTKSGFPRYARIKESFRDCPSLQQLESKKKRLLCL